MSHTSTRQGGGGHAHCEGAHCQFVRFWCSTCHIARLAELIIFSKTLAGNFSLALPSLFLPLSLHISLAPSLCLFNMQNVSYRKNWQSWNKFLFHGLLFALPKHTHTETHTHKETHTHTYTHTYSYIYSYTYIGNELAAEQTEQSKGEKSRENMPRQPPQPQPLPPPLFVLLTRREAWPKEKKRNHSLLLGVAYFLLLKGRSRRRPKRKRKTREPNQIADETKRRWGGKNGKFSQR